MRIRWIHYLAIIAVAFFSLGCANAATGTDTGTEAGSRARAASVLFPQFESVVYATTDVLSRLDSPSGSTPNTGSNQLPISLRLPFIQLLVGLHPLGPDALTTLNTNYSGVLVGAKGFKPPEGLGMFSSQDCYIGLLRPGKHSIIETDLNQSGSQTIDGQKVWTWTAPPFDGYPHTTTYYMADIEHSYFVMGNDLTAFRATMRQLSQGTEDDSKISDPDALTDKAYWAYRAIRYNKVTHDIDPTGTAPQTVTVVMKFTADFGTMTGQLEADTSDAALQTNPKDLPGDAFNYQRKAPGIWVATISIAKDPKSTTALYTVAAVFGFGVVL